MSESILTDEMLERGKESFVGFKQDDNIIGDAAAPSKEMAKKIGDLQEAAKQNNAITGSTDLSRLTPEELAKYARIPRKPKQVVREYKKIGRNEPCPCGSGKKYKNCCLKTGKYEKLVTKQK